MLFAFLILNILAYAHALGFENRVYVPPKSQPNGGQQWYNRGCHDPLIRPAASLESHRKITDIFSANILHGRTNCPYGKQYIKGQCRNVWRSSDPTIHPNALEFGNTINVPQTCSVGEQWINGGCRDPFLKPATSSESHRKITDIFSTNVLHGRTNCPYGKQYINGQCRYIRGSGYLVHPYALEFGNTINVPQICPVGQQWINGGCRNPFLKPATSSESHRKISEISSANTLHVRNNCPGGKYYINGQCRDVWRSADLAIFPYSLWSEKTVNMPKTCSGGRQWYNGGCRDHLLKPATSPESHRYPYALRFRNTVNVPPNGSGGQQWNNGGCRDFLLKLATSLESHRNSLLHQQLKQLWNAYVTKIQEEKIKLEEKPKVVGHNSLRHINLPSQCPFGFRVDALGICCPI